MGFCMQAFNSLDEKFKDYGRNAVIFNKVATIFH